MKYVGELSGSLMANCCAMVLITVSPDALTIPRDSRLPIGCWPCGRYIPKMLSNVRFSPIKMMTCLIGVAVLGPLSSALTGLNGMSVTRTPPSVLAVLGHCLAGWPRGVVRLLDKGWRRER